MLMAMFERVILAPFWVFGIAVDNWTKRRSQ